MGLDCVVPFFLSTSADPENPRTMTTIAAAAIMLARVVRRVPPPNNNSGYTRNTQPLKHINQHPQIILSDNRLTCFPRLFIFAPFRSACPI